jgi:hypothetical protein
VASLLGTARPSWRWPEWAHRLAAHCPLPAELRYWRPVGFSPYYFVVDAQRFTTAFQPTFTPLRAGLARSLGVAP